MRNDEKMALESIYADAFTERVPGRVWEIRLELAVMKQYLRQEEKPNPRDRKKAADEKNVCRFFLRGHCKFGKKCRQRHVNPDKLQVVVDDKHLRRPREENLAFLEVRFPPGSRCDMRNCLRIANFKSSLTTWGLIQLEKNPAENPAQNPAENPVQNPADNTKK